MRTIRDVIGEQPPVSIDMSILHEVDPTNMWVDYDSYVDSLIVFFAKEPVESDNVYFASGLSYLVESDGTKLVGYEIEAFEKSFLPKHPDIYAIWVTLKPSLDQKRQLAQSLGHLLPSLFAGQPTALQPA